MTIFSYYIKQSKTTTPNHYSYLYSDLPKDISTLCHIVQNIFFHYADQKLFKFKISHDRFHELDTRYVSRMLAIIHRYDSESLIGTRDLRHRLIGICRDTSVLLCSILRHQNIPARIRVGFVNYFSSDLFLDGMCVEYWNKNAQKWCYVDTRTSEAHIIKYNLTINFDLHDVPLGNFIPANKAWLMCRKNELPPHLFGSRQHQGLWYIRNKVLQDLAALNKKEALLWDLWGMMLQKHADGMSEDQLILLDELSNFLNYHTYDVAALQSYYERHHHLAIPKKILLANPFYKEKYIKINI